MNNTIKNISSYTVSTILIQITSFILFPILANKLQPENFGKFNYFNTLYLYLNVITILGYSNFISRQCPRESNQIPLIISYLKLKFIFTITVSLIYIALLVYFKISDLPLNLFLIVTLILSIPDFRWLYIANEKLYIVSFINLITQLLFFFILLVLYYFNKLTFYFVFITQSITNLIPIIYFQYIFLKEYRSKICFSNIFVYSKQMISECFYFGFISIIANFNVYFGIIWISSFLGFSSQGIYSVAYKFVLLVNLFFNLIGQVYTPIISKFYLLDKNSLKKHLYHYFILVVLMGGVSILSIKYILPLIFDFLFDNKYRQSLPLIDYLSTTLIPLQILSIFISNILLSTKFSKHVLIALVIGTSYYFISILFFIPEKNITTILHLQVTMELIILLVLSFYMLYFRKKILNNI